MAFHACQEKLVTSFMRAKDPQMAAKRYKKRSNLKDVAAASGCSVATVSRVLNTPSRVREETRLRVERAIAELSFVPSAAARAINRGRTNVFGALIPALDNTIFARTLTGMEREFGRRGLSLVVAATEGDPQLEADKAKQLIDIGVEGLIVTGVTRSAAFDDLIDRTKVPSVAISYFDPAYSLPTIGYSNSAAARVALDHLLTLGHASIAVVHGPTHNNDRALDRLSGLAEPKHAAQLTFFETEFSFAGGGAAATRLDPGAFDAVLCLSDILAMGVLFELQRGGVSVPDQMSVMGLDDIELAQVASPRLSTVRLPAQEMGARAAEALADWVETDIRPDSICLRTELMPRESTRRR